RRAGVDALVDGMHAFLVAPVADLLLRRLHQVREPPIGEAAAPELVQRPAVQVAELDLLEPELDVDDLLDLDEEPRIDARELMHLVDGEAEREGVADVPDALRARLAELELDLLAVLRH